MENDNVIIAYNNIELYQSEIDILCDEYIRTLHDENLIYKSAVFSGLLRYIYSHKLKYIIPDTFSNDYSLLDDIFNNIYISLCSRYNIVPTIIQFCVLCHIDRSNLNCIRNGVNRDGTKVNPVSHCTVKLWYDTCEASLLGKAVNESSIGSIFGLKANYGYKEATENSVIKIETTAYHTPEQIAEKYKQVEKPKLIEL